MEGITKKRGGEKKNTNKQTIKDVEEDLITVMCAVCVILYEN